MKTNKITMKNLLNNVGNGEYMLQNEMFYKLIVDSSYSHKVINGVHFNTVLDTSDPDNLPEFYAYSLPGDSDYLLLCDRFEYEPEDNKPIQERIELFQFYIVSEFTAKKIKEYTDLTVVYFEDLDIYFLCMDQVGTAFSILNVKLKKPLRVL